MDEFPFENRPITQHPIHLIYRLRGSLPSGLVKKMRDNMLSETDQLYRLGRANQNDFASVRGRIDEIKKGYHAKFDQLLDDSVSGPFFLRQREAKRCIIDSWLRLQQLEDLKIFVISVMSNHVHVLLAHNEPGVRIDFRNLMSRHKRYTARFINKLQGKKGRKVWADIAFDRDLRANTFYQVAWYILNNPVKAGLTEDPFSWYGNYVSDDLILRSA